MRPFFSHFALIMANHLKLSRHIGRFDSSLKAWQSDGNPKPNRCGRVKNNQYIFLLVCHNVLSQRSPVHSFAFLLFLSSSSSACVCVTIKGEGAVFSTSAELHLLTACDCSAHSWYDARLAKKLLSLHICSCFRLSSRHSPLFVLLPHLIQIMEHKFMCSPQTDAKPVCLQGFF